MASPYAVSTAGGGSSYAIAPTPVPAGGGTEAKSGGGLLSHLGPVGNLLDDTKNAIVGLPEGILQTVEHPIKTAKEVGQSYAQTYGPLAHGDIKAFLHNVDEHPLGPLLDIATLLTLGGAGAAKLGLTPELAAAQLELRGPAALEGIDGANVVGGKALSRNPVIRARQTAVDRGLKKLPANTPVVGELARFGREVRRGAIVDKAGHTVAMRDYTHAMSELSSRERDALGMLARVPLPKDLDAWQTRLEHEVTNGNADAGALLKRITDAKTRELYEQPSENMLKAHAATADLGLRQAKLLAETGGLRPLSAEIAPYRHMRLARGAETYSAAQAKKAAGQIDRQLSKLRRDQQTVGQIVKRLRKRQTPEMRALRRDATKTASQASRKIGTEFRATEATAKLDELRSKLDHANTQLERLMSAKEISSQEMLDAGLRPGRSTDSLRLRLIGDYHDRATTLAHRYESAFTALVKREGLDAKLPSREELGARQADELERLHAGRRDLAGRLVAGRKELERLGAIEDELQARGADIRPGIVGGPSVEELKNEVAASGRPQPIYLPDVSQAALERKVLRRNASGKDVTVAAARAQTHRSEGTMFLLGKLALDPTVLGPEYLKTVQHVYYRDLHNQLLESAIPVPFRRGERPVLPAGYVWVKRPNERISYLESLPARGDAEALTSSHVDDAMIELANRYMVPERLARQLNADFRQSSTLVQRFFDKPTTVWRALTLNLRVGWLTNNVVGNQLLYAVKHAGPAGLRAYLDAVRDSKGGAAVAELLKIKTPDSLTRQDIDELFPQHSSGGTFLGSQMPDSKVARVAGKATRKITEANQANEGMLRRAAVNAELRKAPEVRARLAAMPKETRSFEKAAKEELAKNPALAREVSQKVNDTLGDFLSMSPAARHYLRGLLPFAAWYRAITLVAIKLPLDSPIRTNILTRVGEIGQQASQDALGELPSYLEGAIPLGGDRLLKTQSVNPFATETQLAPAVGALLAGKPGDPGMEALSSNLNPIVQAGVEELTGKDLYTGAPIKSPPWAPGLAAGLVENVGAGLPQVRLGKSLIEGPPPSKLYDPNELDEILAFLGVPTRTVNRAQAAKLAGGG